MRQSVLDTLRDKVFYLILFALVLGGLGQSFWFIPLLAILLTLWSTIADQHWYDEFKRVGQLDALAWFWLECLAQNTAFVATAFAIGAIIRWWWL